MKKNKNNNYMYKLIVKSIHFNAQFDKNMTSILVPENFNLGYACINMNLREQKPPVFTSRTCRLATFKSKGLDYIKELALHNLKDLLTILKWNKENNILFMRLSSEIFPFASHPELGYSIDFADELLLEIGNYAKEHKMRLTMHPGQYNVLSSPNQKVVDNTILDLNHHNNILNKMGMGNDSVLIIHGGGVYGNKKKSLERLEENLLKLPESTFNRIVLENCEMAYTVEELLPISEKLKIPIVIDFHHDQLNPSSETIDFYFDRVFAIWSNRNIKPKVHVSNSIPEIIENNEVGHSLTARRKHSDYISFFHDALLKITFDIDVMLECKMKEKALLKCKFAKAN